jgi:GT2 family glycosyltransferase
VPQLPTSAGASAAPAAAGQEFSVCVLICTRDRPGELRRALASIADSSVPVARVVVSDDSTDERTRRLVEEEFPEVAWTAGPQVGLGANRNRALELGEGGHVLFIDDDVVLAPDFLERIRARWLELAPHERERTILAGAERQGELTITPNEQGFLGFQNRPYRAGEPLRTVVINAAVFPRPLFEHVRFDPQLVYGYDEVDLTSRAVAAGFRIAPCFDAVNLHFPADSNRDYYSPYVEASRLYVTLKRRMRSERRRLSGAAYCAAAGAHTFASAIRRHGRRGPRLAWGTVRQALAYYRGRPLGEG